MMTKIVVSIIGSIFQTLSSLVILQKQNDDCRKNNALKFFIALFILNLICSLFVRNDLRFIFSLSSLLFIMYFIMKYKGKNSIIYSFMIILFLAFSEFFVSIIMVLIGFSSKDIVKNDYYNLIANIIISILPIVLVIIPFIKRIIRSINSFFLKNKKAIQYIYMLLIIIYLLSLKNGLEFLLSSNYYINIFVYIGVVFLLLFIINKEIKYYNLQEINKQSLNYISKYEKIITTQGKANHEFKNQLMVIRGYAQINSPKLIEYLDSIVDDTKTTKSTYLISQLNKFPDGGIKGLLYYKLSIMEEENIKYSIYCGDNVKRKSKSLTSEQMKNITKILGVIIDNAIDECKSMNEKDINIDLTAERGKMVFTISNTINKDIKPLLFGTGFTTKGKNHGYGLQLVKDILNISNYIEYNHQINDDHYIVTLIIKTGNKKTYKN